MPITDSYARLPLASIFVDRDKRQRRELNSKGLIESIRNLDVLNPVIIERQLDVEGRHRLVAGERRYLACQELGKPDIPVRFADELSDMEAEIYELEENIKREDLDWQDIVNATARIHALYKQRDPDWSQASTAESIGLSDSAVSKYLNVHRHMHDPKISSQETVIKALHVIQGRERREEAAIVDELSMSFSKSRRAKLKVEAETSEEAASEPPPPPPPLHDYRSLQDPAKNILLEDFRLWAPKYSGNPFNLIHCDFPYGISVFAGPQSGVDRHHIYDDSREIHFQLLETLLVNFDRLASRSCHVVYWFSMQHYDTIRQMVRELAPELIIHTHPLIWHKSDNSGIASDPHHLPRHIYETALLMSRGKRRLVNLASDAYSCPTGDKLWHIHTKPEPMLKYFFSMFVDNHTNLLDPTCGSGSAVRAAESLGARWVLGMDSDETIVGQARASLRHARAKSGMAVAD